MLFSPRHLKHRELITNTGAIATKSVRPVLHILIHAIKKVLAKVVTTWQRVGSKETHLPFISSDITPSNTRACVTEGQPKVVWYYSSENMFSMQ